MGTWSGTFPANPQSWWKATRDQVLEVKWATVVTVSQERGRSERFPHLGYCCYDIVQVVL